MDKVERRRLKRPQGLANLFRFATGIALGASLCCVLASAAQASRHDGVFWVKLGSQDKIAYIAGYADAMRTSIGKFDNLRAAAGIFHWKGADRILGEIACELDMSGLPADRLVASLDKIYLNPRYADFEVANEIELAALRDTSDLKSITSEPPRSSTVSRAKR